MSSAAAVQHCLSVCTIPPCVSLKLQAQNTLSVTSFTATTVPDQLSPNIFQYLNGGGLQFLTSCGNRMQSASQRQGNINNRISSSCTVERKI